MINNHLWDPFIGKGLAFLNVDVLSFERSLMDAKSVFWLLESWFFLLPSCISFWRLSQWLSLVKLGACSNRVWTSRSIWHSQPLILLYIKPWDACHLLNSSLEVCLSVYALGTFVVRVLVGNYSWAFLFHHAGLPWAVDDSSLREAFSQYGEVIEGVCHWLLCVCLDNKTL